MGFRDESLSLSWINLLEWDTLAFILIGVVLMVLVFKKPNLFWPSLIVICIIGIGPRIKGYFFIDELYAFFLIIGALLRILIRKTTFKGIADQHKIIFNLWIIYMIFESFIGIIVNEDLRIFRWVIFFIIIGILSLILLHGSDEFPMPKPNKLAWIILVTTTIYYCIYLGQGMYFELILDVGEYGRFLSQDNFWSGSAYAVFPTLIAMPSALIIIINKSKFGKVYGYLSICLMMFISYYYDSRISWIVIFGCLLTSIRFFNIKQIVGISLITSIFLFTLYGEKISYLFDDLFEVTQSFNNPNKSNIGRNLATQAGIEAWTRSPLTFIIGDGMYSHKKTAIPFAENLYSKYMPPDDFHIPGSRDESAGGMTSWNTTSFVGLLVDTGIIGIFIFVLIFFFVISKLLKRNPLNSSNLIFMSLMVLPWTLVNNITDILLLYLIIMPRGLAEALSINKIEKYIYKK